MKQYISFFKLKFICGLQYRAAALAGLSTQLFFGIVSVMVYILFYSSGTSNVGITLEQIITYLWLNQAFFALIYIWHKDNEILKMIRNGDIAYELCRPQNLYVMWYMRILSSKLSAVLLRSVPIIMIAYLLPKPYKMMLPISINAFILFIFIMIISTLLITSIIVLLYIISSYTVDDKGIFAIVCTISDILSGQAIPLALFPPLFATIISFLPFAYISDFAFRVFSGNIVGFAITKGIIIELLWTIFLTVIGYILTNRILKRVVVQGG